MIQWWYGYYFSKSLKMIIEMKDPAEVRNDGKQLAAITIDVGCHNDAVINEFGAGLPVLAAPALMCAYV